MGRHQCLLTAGEVVALGTIAGKVIAHLAARCPPGCRYAGPCRLFAARVVNPLPG